MSSTGSWWSTSPPSQGADWYSGRGTVSPVEPKSYPAHVSTPPPRPSAQVSQSAVAAVAVAMLLTYGYEIFNFNLSLDEPVFGGGGQRGLAVLWAEQGRWAMALQYALLPDTVLPAISTGLGAFLIGCSLWVFATRVMELAPVVAGLVTAVAATLPALGFALSFATIAVGVGLGFVAVTVFGVFAAKGGRWPAIGALLAGMTAIGIYQAFAFCLAAISVVLLARSSSWRLTALRQAALLLGSYVASELTNRAVKMVLGAGSNSYVSTMMDLDGVASDPLARIAGSLSRNWDVLAPGAQLYDGLQPWLVLALGLLTSLAVRSVVRGDTGAPRPVAATSVALLLGLPILAGVVVAELPVRSMLYLPVCVITLAGIAFTPPRRSQPTQEGHSPQRVVLNTLAAAVAVLAVIANAWVTNSAYVAADASFAQDRFLAMRINEELGRLFPNTDDPVPIVVTAPDRRENGTVGHPAEQFGLSLFSGESWRATSFLTSQGVQVGFPNAEQERAGLVELASMPAYPSAGWARSFDGVLLANLGPDDTTQR